MSLVTSASNALFLQALFNLAEKTRTEYENLRARLGVKPPPEKVVVIVIAEKEFEGHSALFDLFEECEKLYGKGRRVDEQRIRRVTCKSLDQASKSPSLEMASFVLIVDGHLLDAASYPELADILPFQ